MGNGDVSTVTQNKHNAAIQKRIDALRKEQDGKWLRGPQAGGGDIWQAFNGPGLNANAWSMLPRFGRDPLQEMRNISALEAAARGPRSFVREVAGHALQDPHGLAFTDEGDVWVTDKGRHVVVKFTDAGEFIQEIGGFGAGDGEFNQPAGIAIDSSGNLYVMDSLNFRVQKFDLDGVFIRKWGSQGSGDSQFRGIVGLIGPQNIGIGASQNVYVPENGLTPVTGANRVQIFDSDGVFISNIAALEGETIAPAAIAFDANQNIYIETNTSTDKIWKIAADGDVILDKFMDKGFATGEANVVAGMAIDSNDHIYMTDKDANRIQVLDTDGNFVREFGTTGTTVRFFKNPLGVALDSDENPFITDGGDLDFSPALERFENNGRVQRLTPDGAARNPGEFWFSRTMSNPWGIFVDGDDKVYVNANITGAVAPSIDSGAQFDLDGNLLLDIGSFSTSRPDRAGAVVDDSGNMYLVVDNGATVAIYGPDGVRTGTLVPSGTNRGLAIDSSNNIYVANGSWIQKYKPDGTLLLSIMRPGTGDGEFQSVASVAVDSSGNIYATDQELHRVQKLDPDGVFVLKFGIEGDGDGEFDTPIGIAIIEVAGPAEKIYVVDSGNHRVQRFDSAGVFESEFGSKGVGDSEFQIPKDIAFDSEDNIYVTDFGNRRVQKFTDAHAFVAEFGTTARNVIPAGVAADADGNSYANDNFRGTIKKYDSDDAEVWTVGGAAQGPANSFSITPTPFNVPPGEDDGKFLGFGHMALDSDSILHVVDSSSGRRVQRFDPDGSFLSRYGDGFLTNPGPIAVGSDGSFYVLDTLGLGGGANDWTVARYDTEGNFLSRFGEEVLAADTALESSMVDLTVDGDDNVYMVERIFVSLGPTVTNGRVHKFDSDGVFLLSFGESEGYSRIDGVDVGADGLIYITVEFTAGGDAVDTWSAAGVKQESLGIPGSKAPRSIAVDELNNMRIHTGSNEVRHYRRSGGTLVESSPVISGNSGAFNTVESLLYTNGTLYVADGGNARVQSFVNATAAFIAEFGTPGDGDGEFGADGPQGLALSLDNNILVPDPSNGRIQTFDQDGNFVSEVNNAGRFRISNEAPTPGRSFPWGVALDEDDNSFVSDNGIDKIMKFDAQQEFVMEFGAGPVSDVGRLHEPHDAAVDSAGNTWVTDRAAHKLVQFDAAGVFVAEFGVGGGASGSGDGEFNGPRGIAIDSADNVWIVDAGNDRIQVLDSAGTFLFEFGTGGAVEGEFTLADSIAILETDDDTFIFITDTSADKVLKFDAAGTFLMEWESFFSGPTGVAVDSEGKVYVVDTGNARVQVFTDVGVFEESFGDEGDGVGEFLAPEGIAIDGNDNAFVSDKTGNKVLKFDSDHAFDSEFGTPGTGESQFAWPRGVAVDGSDDVYVVDSRNDRIQKFDNDGVFDSEFGEGIDDGELDDPRGLAVDSDGNVYVVDTGHDRIQVFDGDGNFLYKWGVPGSGDGEFSVAEGITIDEAGIVWVTDSGNNRRIQGFTKSGAFIEEFGSGGETLQPPNHGTMNNPVDIAAGANGDLYVACQDYDRVNVYGKRLLQNNQTQWSKWTVAGEVSLGISDGGVSVPDLTALDSLANLVAPETLEQMRDPIEALALLYINPDTGQPYNFVDQDDVNNLYRLALGNRDTSPSDFGYATPTPGYDWEHDLATMRIQSTYDLDIGELALCVDKLQASTPA